MKSFQFILMIVFHNINSITQHLEGRTMTIILLVLQNIYPLMAQNSVEGRDFKPGNIAYVAGISSEEFVDFAPVVSPDGKTMLFESNRGNGWKLFESKLNANGFWSAPNPMESINNFGKRNDLIGGPSLSYDGNYLYFFAYFLYKGTSEDIYVSKRGANGWETPEKLGAPINTNAFEGFPSISPDNRTLYFIRENEAHPVDANTGEPCFVIHKSVKDYDGRWSEPEALPAQINMGCERSPKIMSDGKTLLFSSIRKGGIGGFDIYQTRLNDQGEWAEPILIEGLNTDADDLSPSITAAGDEMFFLQDYVIVKSQVPSGFGPLKTMTLEGHVKNTETGLPVTTDIEIINKTTGETISYITTDGPDGWYSIVLTAGTLYQVNFYNEGQEPLSFVYDLTDLTENKKETRTIAIEADRAIII